MDNVLSIFVAVWGIAEAITSATVEKASQKIPKIVWATLVAVACAIGGIVFDIIFNQPTITLQYILDCIGLILGSSVALKVGFDSAKELLEKWHNATKKGA